MASKKSELLVFVLEHNMAVITEPVCNLGGVTLLLSTRSNFCNIFGHKFYGTQFSFELHNKSTLVYQIIVDHQIIVYIGNVAADIDRVYIK